MKEEQSTTEQVTKAKIMPTNSEHLRIYRKDFKIIRQITDALSDNLKVESGKVLKTST